MRFAPPNPLRIADRATGLNAVSVRTYNERLVLSLLLQKDTTTRLEIGERTGLSAQTVSVLVRSLEQEGLVARGPALKGRIGPPTVPVSLNPEGAFAVGISVGEQYTDVVLIDFVGEVRFQTTLSSPEPTPGSNHSEFLETIRKAVDLLPAKARGRLAGVGLALPHNEAGHRDEEAYFKALQDEIEVQLGLSVFVQNDITAAASGEGMFGEAKRLTDYMFFYLGAELHGRLILNHQIYNGNSSVSFDVGLNSLERELIKHGKRPPRLHHHPEDWEELGIVLTSWKSALIEQMSKSVDAVSQFVDFDTVVLSSEVPMKVCEDICRELESSVPRVRAIAGKTSPSPKAVGAASLPFSSRFTVEGQ
jgi:predicted DNA-binding transcriptional regulator